MIEMDFEFFDTLIRTDAFYVIITHVKDYFSQFIVDTYSELLSINHELFILYTEYVASGIINMYIEWFKSNRAISLENLGQAAGQITFQGLMSIVKTS